MAGDCERLVSKHRHAGLVLLAGCTQVHELFLVSARWFLISWGLHWACRRIPSKRRDWEQSRCCRCPPFPTPLPGQAGFLNRPSSLICCRYPVAHVCPLFSFSFCLPCRGQSDAWVWSGPSPKPTPPSALPALPVAGQEGPCPGPCVCVHVYVRACNLRVCVRVYAPATLLQGSRGWAPGGAGVGLPGDPSLQLVDSFFFQMKTGPFAEHSNQLWNISAVPSWSKVNQGLIRMYKAEVSGHWPARWVLGCFALIPTPLFCSESSSELPASPSDA